jgi:hypothetical protein
MARKPAGRAPEIGAMLLVFAFSGRAFAQEPVVQSDFSATLLREGEAAFLAQRPLEALGPLRIAAFGFLDRPAMLCEALTYQALVEQALPDKRSDALKTVGRLSEIDRGFPSCGQAKIDPAVRAEFEKQFHRAPPGAQVVKAPTPRSGRPS